MSDAPVTYKIRRGSYFSNGIITQQYRDDQYTVKWSKKGKEWTSEKLLKAHLTKWIELTGSIPADWEIFELHYETKPVMDWIDNNMLAKILTYKK